MNYENEKKEFISLIKSLSGSYSTYQVFSDFCELAAISLYQPFAQNEELENKYLNIISKYKKKEVDIFPKLLACVVSGLSVCLGDFLGECYMDLEISNKYQGQFFTPYHVSKFMSLIVGIDLDENGKETISEPAVGSGGMIIARADVLQEQNINFQTAMEVQAVDTDKMCFFMSYIHFSLLHISAEVIWGDSLSCEVFEIWHTPANILNKGYRWGLIFPHIKEEKEPQIVKNVSLPVNALYQGTLF